MKKLVLVGMLWGIVAQAIPEFVESCENEYRREQERQLWQHHKRAT